MMQEKRHTNRFVWYAWGILAYTILVILWGALVRATGSGAGCGSHWPLCNGEVIPHAPHVATLIEFGHRVTSGVALLLVVGLVVWAVRRFPPGDGVRGAAWWSLLFMISESLIGAALVLLELVGQNASVYRAVWMMAHVGNMFLLLATLTLTCWWAGGGGRLHLQRHGMLTVGLGVGLLGLLWLSMSGAVAALGNTLFPAETLLSGMQQDFSPTAHLFIRLRVFHPVIGAFAGLYLLGLVSFVHQRIASTRTRRLTRGVLAIFGVQAIAGVLNIALLAPVWLQLIHLLLATLLWVVLVLLCAEALAQPTAYAARSTTITSSVRGP